MAERNRLASEASAYLKSAAEQPVDWHPWGEEAFRRAKELDRPVLLDIGAVWCHWCHVMDRESYENAETAKAINQRFVAVKVDRDERPDVDARYQRAVSAITGQGGWPLTAFLTPDGEVFYGGTYFPPDDSHGRPGFRRVLHGVADEYGRNRGEVLSRAKRLRKALEERASAARGPGDLGQELLAGAMESFSRDFDPIHGGFSTAPKFPHTGTVELLLARAARDGDENALMMADATLKAMARGGVHDQVGGGFHRYSTDREWVVPHFEKMIHDNAELLRNYVHAYQITADEEHRLVAEGIIDWVLTTMCDRSRGGFYASQDADLGPEDDGSYFTWSLEEMEAALPGEEFEILRLHYGVGKVGEMRHDPSQNVLHVSLDPVEITARTGVPEEEVVDIIRSGRERLLAARLRTEAPFVDVTPYTNWNGMMVSAFLEAYRVLWREEVLEAATRTLDRFLEEAWVEDEGFLHRVGEGPVVGGLLDDQAKMARALVDAYEVVGDPRYLDRAVDAVRLMDERFWDEETGGYFDVAGDGPGRVAPGMKMAAKPIMDAPTPSPNAVAAILLDRIHLITGDEAYRRRSEELLRGFAGEAAGGGVFAGTYFQAVDLHLAPRGHAVVVGDSEELRRAALSAYAPGIVVMVVPPGDADARYLPPAAADAIRGHDVREGPAAFVCVGNTCAPPTDDPDAVRRVLRTGLPHS